MAKITSNQRDKKVRNRTTAIIPVFNQAALTAKCLETIMGRDACDVVVVDDCSTDMTLQVLASYGKRIRIVKHELNGGFAKSCNDGAALALTDYVVFLNNDTIPQPGWLEALERYADDHPKAAVVGSKLLYPTNTIQHAGVVICQDRYPRHLYTGFSSEHPAVNKSRRFQIVSGACMLVRRPIFERAGAFDTAFRNGFEDVDFCLRLGEAGHQVHYCADSVVHHLESVSPGRFKNDRHNVALYRERWLDRLQPDDLQYYVEDGLLSVSYEGSYPLHMKVSPFLAALETNSGKAEAHQLLIDQSRQIADLTRENTRLRVELGGQIPASPAMQYEQLRQQIRQAVGQTVPTGATVLVVTKGDGLLLDLEDRQAWHFPQTDKGAYIGHHPADSSAAIAHLEALRAKGADYLVIPETSFWWLDYYKVFGEHLRRHYAQKQFTLSESHNRCCVIFSLIESQNRQSWENQDRVKAQQSRIESCAKSSNSRMKIAHFGTFDVENYGDLLFPLILEKRLGGLGCEFVHASPRGGPPIWADCLPTVAIETLLENPIGIDAVITGGGHVVHASPTTLDAYNRGGISAIIAYPSLWLGAAYVGARNNAKVCWNAPSVAQPFSPAGAGLVRWVASVADYLAVRDPTSEVWLRDAGVVEPIHVVPDTALEVSGLWSRQEIDGAYADAFSVRRRELPPRTVTFHLNSRFTGADLDGLAERLDRICQRQNATAILLATGPCHGDGELQRLVGGKMKTNPLIIDQPQSLREIAACIARSQAYIGSSLHGIITACSFGRRGMIVMPKANAPVTRVAGFLEAFNLSQWHAESWQDAEERLDALFASPAAVWQWPMQRGLPMLDDHWNRIRDILATSAASESQSSAAIRRNSMRADALGTTAGPPAAQIFWPLVSEQVGRLIIALRSAEEDRRKLGEAASAWNILNEQLRANASDFQRERQSWENDLHQRLSRAQSEFALLERSHQETQDAKASLEGNLQRLQVEATEHKAALTEVQNGLTKRDALIRDLQASLEEKTAQLARAAEESSSRANTIHDLEDTVRDLQHRLSQREGLIRDLQDRLVERNIALRKSLDEQESHSRRMQAALEASSAAQRESACRSSEQLTLLTRKIDGLVGNAYSRTIHHVREAVASVVPPGRTVLVVSKGDEQLLQLGCRRALHFPQAKNGTYAGEYPADSAAAIRHLEILRSQRAEFLAFPETAFWWLDYYKELHRHLDAHYESVRSDNYCVIYRLSKKRRVPRWDIWKQRTSRPSAGKLRCLNERTYARLIIRIQEVVETLLPYDAVISIVSKGDDNLLKFGARRAWHFPQTEQGAYVGYHPATDDDAIAYIEKDRVNGAGFLIFPQTASWWLNYYKGLRRHLELHYSKIWSDDSCAIFMLAPGRVEPVRLQRLKHLWLSLRVKYFPNIQSRNSYLISAAPGKPSDVNGTPKPGGRNCANSAHESSLHPNLVTVIVPIYNAYAEVRRCVDSLIRHGAHPHQVLLIDDCSPDERVWPMLQSYMAINPHVNAIRNTSNLGYTVTVNKGCALAPGDVVLLNSDTEVTRDWLEKLAACASSNDQIATVTPLSNSAGAFSVPVNNRANQIPVHFSVDAMAALVAVRSRKLWPRVPTGNGFCLYITRRALNSVGYFDDVNFPRGYGEENDFCMRAIAKGLLNVIDDSTFIYHKESASFLEAKANLLAKGAEKLNALHPTYHRSVAQWLANDPLDPLRSSIARDLADPNCRVPEISVLPTALVIVHDGGGGTDLMAEDLIRGIAGSFRCVFLKTGMAAWTLYEHHDDGFKPSRKYLFREHWRVQESVATERMSVLRGIVRDFKIELAHVHHLIGNGPEIISELKSMAIPVVFSFHDFYTICPTIQLLDEQQNFCAGRCTASEGECGVAPNLFHGEVPPLKHRFVYQHRNAILRSLELCDRFTAPSNSTYTVLRATFPFLNDRDLRVIEHGRDLDERQLSVPPQKGRVAKILCLGNLDVAKGVHLIRQVMELDAKSGPRFEFHFLGKKILEFQPERYGGIYHGSYSRDDLPGIVRRIGPSFAMIASIWPETYCYTLTESWALGLPVFASDTGALKERIEAGGGGWLLNYKDAQAWYAEMLRVLAAPAEYQVQRRIIAAKSFKPVAQMADEYREMYLDLLASSPASALQRPFSTRR